MDTGLDREVDILISTNQAGYRLQIGIEVVEWTRLADVSWVERMIQKHSRLPTDKLVLISKSGFTKSATAKAQAHGVEAIKIEEAQELDWPLAVSAWWWGLPVIQYKLVLNPTSSR